MYSASQLEENEFRLIQEIAKNSTRTQRDLSQSVGLSLGTTNLLIQRLARKGLIKVTQLDWKRTQYLLTLKGALEKSRKAYDYALYTLRMFRQIQENISTALKREYEAGRRHFHVVAQDELIGVLHETVAETHKQDCAFSYYKSYEELPNSADLVMTALSDPPPADGPNNRRYVSLVDFNNINFRI